ncbi:MAG TPA: hypothetical protein VGQ03_04925 [Nitrososphaera sp.]|nr:hypothetical protein [Nitrososphaera sp.]
MVRVSKRLVRYNTVEEEDVTSRAARHTRYSCEKCGKVFAAWKYLRQHKVEKHSY